MNRFATIQFSLYVVDPAQEILLRPINIILDEMASAIEEGVEGPYSTSAIRSVLTEFLTRLKSAIEAGQTAPLTGKQAVALQADFEYALHKLESAKMALTHRERDRPDARRRRQQDNLALAERLRRLADQIPKDAR